MLSRIQFALNITFHILFPSITIALSWILLFFRGCYAYTKNYNWMHCYFFFTKVFALSFSIGIVSGITMSFQFGTNWPGFMNKVGNIAGPLLAYEVLTAFFLEASFLGIMLFGFRKVSSKVHIFSTFLVAFGTTLSAFWILVLNSRMHTPTGYEIIDGKAHVISWYDIIFNPSMPYRFFHMFLASGLTAAFLIMGLSALRFLKCNKSPVAHLGLKTGLYLAAILAPFQMAVGHIHGLNTKEVQPAKFAAMEAAWKTETGAPLVLFAIPNEELGINEYSIQIPYLGSLIATNSINGEIKGLEEFSKHPPVKPVFIAFRIMVGLGTLMILVAWYASFIFYRKQKLPKWLYMLLVAMTSSGFIATTAGWYVTEIGRQPWLVQNLLLTRDALGSAPPSNVLFTLIIYSLVYLFITISYISTLIYMTMHAGDHTPSDPERQGHGEGQRHTSAFK